MEVRCHSLSPFRFAFHPPIHSRERWRIIIRTKRSFQGFDSILCFWNTLVIWFLFAHLPSLNLTAAPLLWVNIMRSRVVIAMTLDDRTVKFESLRSIRILFASTLLRHPIEGKFKEEEIFCTVVWFCFVMQPNVKSNFY